jgi:DDE superfamily endonuclease
VSAPFGGHQRDQLRAFRTELYRCMAPWGDSLFELTDAALCAPGSVASVPSLSLEPVFRRSHGSLYKALALGDVSEDRLRALLVDYRPADWPQVFAVDASAWARCDAECSPERGFCYSASRHSAGKPIVAGWNYQWISQLCFTSDSWTAPLDAVRISPLADATDSTIEQVQRLCGLLGEHNGQVPLFVFDAGYNPIALSVGLGDQQVQVLVRIKSDRVFYADPVKARTPARGRPQIHGCRYKLKEPKTAPKPDAELVLHDHRYGNVRIRAWHDLHPRLSSRRWTGTKLPIVRGSVIRVDVERLPKPFPGAKKTLYLWWSGPGEPDLSLCFRSYLRRFDIEHTYRFAKNTLGWTTPLLQTPEQADRWTWLVIAAYTQLRLARRLVDDLRLPWESRLDPTQLTPLRVRRGFRRLRATIGTPASPPKSDAPGPGRPKGTATGPRKRYPVIKKGARGRVIRV